MSAEVPPEGIETAIVSQNARADGMIIRLRGDIEGLDDLRDSLRGEMEYCLRRISEIPEAIAHIEEWKNRLTQQLEILERNGTDNGHIPSGHLNLHD